MTAGNWKALKNEWSAIVSEHRNDDATLQRQVDRLIERWDGELEDVGTPFVVGIVRLGDDSFAQVSVDAIAQFDGLEKAMFDPPVEEVCAEEVR